MGLSVCSSVCHHDMLLKPHIFGTMYARILKFHIGIVYEKLADLICPQLLKAAVGHIASHCDGTSIHAYVCMSHSLEGHNLGTFYAHFFSVRFFTVELGPLSDLGK